jgi:acyl carrier protein
MKKEEIEKGLIEAMVLIKGNNILPLNYSDSLVKDYGFESLDIIDLFFEIQRITGIEIDLTEMAVNIGALDGRRFNDLTIEDLLKFLFEKANV